jgi:membrane fusion protein, copper/silver efflux system
MTTTKTVVIIIASVVLVGFAFGIGHWTGHMHAAHDHEAARFHDGHAEPAAAEAGEQWYTCSMHPQVRTTDPREKCPFCGMDLIPVPTDGDDGDPTLPRLSLSPRAAALMQVQTWPVERRNVSRPVRLFGRVDFDQQRIRRVSAWVDGRIDELYVDYCCAEVEAGERMFLLYSPTLIAAQEELLQAVRAGTRARRGGAGSAAAAGTVGRADRADRA